MKVCFGSVCHDVQVSPVVQAFIRLAESCTVGVHQWVDDPSLADLLLIVDCHLNPDWKLQSVQKHPWVRRYPDRTVVYDERDQPWCHWRGLYVSMPQADFDPRFQRAWGYYGLSDQTAFNADVCEPDLLFSFMGTPGHWTSKGHKLRKSILQLRHQQGFVEDSGGFVFYDDRGDPESHEKQQRHFAESIRRSKFVLCPRGCGTSSIRLYEVMRAGRVPVILSDQWVAPNGPAWKSFSLRIAESTVGSSLIDSLLAAETEWRKMAVASWQAYQKWFAPEVMFHNLVEACIPLIATSTKALPRRMSGRYVELYFISSNSQIRALGKAAAKGVRRFVEIWPPK